MVSPASGPIRLFVLGDARIETPVATIEPSAEIVFATALYLILERHHLTSRQSLAVLLWPNVVPDVAGHRLRQTLLKLRQVGIPVLRNGHARLSLSPVEIAVDFELFTATPEGRDPRQIPLTLLPGYEPKFSSGFAEWLDRQRSDAEAAFSRITLEIIANARILGHWDDVETNARHLLQFTPHNEEATLAVAEALAMRGEKIECYEVIDSYLAEIGGRSGDLRLPAAIMRRRIKDRLPSQLGASADVRLVGRDVVMRSLNGVIDRAMDHKGSVFLLRGDAGIGKSRVISDFVSFATLEGLNAHRIHCRASDSTHPLSLLLDLIPILRSMRGAIGSAPETLNYLDGLSQHRPEAIRPAHGYSEIASSQLEYALADLLDAVSEDSPLILAIEDLHWIDPISADILAAVIERCSTRPIVFALSSRCSLVGSLASIENGSVAIELGPLHDDAARELVSCILERHESKISAPYLAWCLKVAEGNPYFIQELLHHWLDTGEEHRAPPSLTAVLRQRLSLLTPEALQLLQTCALLENLATVDTVEKVLGYSPHILLTSIDDLASSGMVVTPQVDGSGAFGGPLISSRHDLLSDIALEQLALPAKAYLHRRAAQVLEQTIGETHDASTLWACAKHWQLAGDSEHALRLAMSCANHLLNAGLPNEAAEAFERSLVYCTTDRDKLIALEGEARALYGASSWQRVIDTVNEARDAQRRLAVDVPLHDELELMALRSEWQFLDWNNTLSKVMVCLAEESASAAHRVEAGVMALMLIGFNSTNGSHETAFEQIMVLAADPSIPAHLVLQAKMVYHTNWGFFPEAVAAARSLVAEQRARGNVGEVFRALCNTGVILRAAGMWNEAASSIEEALALADAHHLILANARAIPMLANLALEVGDTEAARYWLARLTESPVASEDRLTELEIRGVGARLALLDGDPIKANALWRREIDRATTDPVPHRRTYNAALQVAIELSLSKRATQESVSTLRRVHLESRGNVFQAFASFSLYVGLLSIGRAGEAETLLAEYLNLYRREPYPAPLHLLEPLLASAGLEATSSVLTPSTNSPLIAREGI